MISVNKLKVLDSHCHLSFLSSAALEQLLISNKDESSWVMGGYDPKDWSIQSQHKAQYPKQLYTSCGLHPWHVLHNADSLEEDFLKLQQQSQSCDLIGEVGLDFAVRGDVRRSHQEEWFCRQLALETDKPYVFHIVKAHDSALKLISESGVSRGLVHGFSGNKQIAEKYLDRGFYISLGGILRRGLQIDYEEMVRWLPSDRLLVESDAPARPSETVSPDQVWLENLSRVAGLRGVTEAEMVAQIENNLNALLLRS